MTDDDLEDWHAWERYPQHRWVFNKLELSLKLGYTAGPVPLPVPVTGEYILRPIYNLSGMGAGAKIVTLEVNRVYDHAPGYFWCERFVGDHLSVNYQWHNNCLIETHTSVGEIDFENLSKFRRWYKIENQNIPLPQWINEFTDVDDINIEFIDGRIIEIHLRKGSYFPDGATELISVWSTTAPAEISQYLGQGYKFYNFYIDAEKNISEPLLGFLYK